jgi:hypothetical protein
MSRRLDFGLELGGTLAVTAATSDGSGSAGRSTDAVSPRAIRAPINAEPRNFVPGFSEHRGSN